MIVLAKLVYPIFKPAWPKFCKYVIDVFDIIYNLYDSASSSMRLISTLLAQLSPRTNHDRPSRNNRFSLLSPHGAAIWRSPCVFCVLPSSREGNIAKRIDPPITKQHSIDSVKERKRKDNRR
jgi:hypothetical protein